MAYDIYGNNLRPGHCEVHPHIHEEYPCSTCMTESRQSQQQPEYDKVGELEHYLGQAQQEIERLTAENTKMSEAAETGDLITCWCGARGTYEEMFLDNGPIRCGGLGSTDCRCGGDICVCHNHGEIECYGCEDCEGGGFDDDDDWHESQEDSE